jgi:hypothetical protein
MVRKALRISLMVQCMAYGSGIFAEAIPISPDTQLLEVGKRIYREGILSTGQKMEGLTVGDISLSGAQAACVNCHRRSGMGGAEAGQWALPITGEALYKPGPPSLWYQHEISQPNTSRFRPAYTDVSLANAIRTGVTPTGRTLQQTVMPRFKLADANIAALIAYLKSLSDASPAVDDGTIHFATIVTPDADPVEKNAMLDVMTAFFKERNAETSRYRNNGHIPPNRGFAPLLNWELHVWELQGSHDTWQTQLEDNFRKRPVLAVLAGVGANWQPAHDFCENMAVACLFPNTNVPTTKETPYTVYFSKGLTLEAETLAESIRTDKIHQHNRIIQVYRDDLQGKVPATAFLQAMQKTKTGSKLKDYKIAVTKKLDVAFWRKLIKTEHPDALILWLNEQDLANLKLSGTLPSTVYLSGHRLKGRVPEFLKSTIKKVYLVSPWESQQKRTEHFTRMRTWLEGKQLPITDELIQGNVLWLLWLVDEAVEQITNHFSPDYLIERIEELMGNLKNTSLYPRISLGPGQRFVVKNCNILEAGEGGV